MCSWDSGNMSCNVWLWENDQTRLHQTGHQFCNFCSTFLRSHTEMLSRMCVAGYLEQVQAKGQMRSVICVCWCCVLMFPVQSLQYTSTLVVLNSVFHPEVFISYLVAYTVYKHPFLAHCLIWGPEITVPLVLTRRRDERESEMGKAT